MNNAMNPPYGSTGGQPGQGGIPGVPPQPMMRPGFSIPLQQQPPRPYAPPPAGFMPSQGLAPGQPAAPVMPPGVHSSCHGEHGKSAHGCEPSSSYVVCLIPYQTIATAIISAIPSSFAHLISFTFYLSLPHNPITKN